MQSGVVLLTSHSCASFPPDCERIMTHFWEFGAHLFVMGLSLHLAIVFWGAV